MVDVFGVVGSVEGAVGVEGQERVTDRCVVVRPAAAGGGEARPPPPAPHTSAPGHIDYALHSYTLTHPHPNPSLVLDTLTYVWVDLACTLVRAGGGREV